MKTPLKENIQFNSTGVIKGLIPAQSKVHSFLLYDGNVELKLAASSRQVVAHTNNYVVHEFWECVLENPRGMLRKKSVIESIPIRKTVTYCSYGDTRMKPIRARPSFSY